MQATPNYSDAHTYVSGRLHSYSPPINNSSNHSNRKNSLPILTHQQLALYRLAFLQGTALSHTATLPNTHIRTNRSLLSLPKASHIKLRNQIDARPFSPRIMPAISTMLPHRRIMDSVPLLLSPPKNDLRLHRGHPRHLRRPVIPPTPLSFRSSRL